MAKLQIYQSSFSGGMLSPLLQGRIDTDIYKKSVKQSINTVHNSQGSIEWRPGTIYLQPVSDSAAPTVLVPFTYGDNSDYILEFGAGYFRVFTNDSNFNPVYLSVEVATTFTDADIPNLYYFQNKSQLYIAVGRITVQVVERIDDTTWRIIPYDPRPAPSSLKKTTETTTITLGAVSGSGINVNCGTAGLFNESAVGRQIKESDEGGDAVITAYVGTNDVTVTIIKTFTSTTVPSWDFVGTPDGQVQSSETRQGRITTLTGTVSAFHYADVGDYIYVASGVIQIISKASDISGEGLILRRISDGASTPNWILESTDWVTSYPKIVDGTAGRLWLLSSIEFLNRIWGSSAGDFNDHFEGSGDADAISEDISGCVDISWMAVVQNILLGTITREYVISGGQDGITALSIKADSQTPEGSVEQRPLVIGSSVVFTDRTRRNVRTMTYNFETNSYQVGDLSYVSENISAARIIKMCYIKEVSTTIYCLMDDGTILTALYDTQHQELGWNIWRTDGLFKDIQVIVNKNDTFQLWTIVSRDTDLGTLQYIEVFKEGIYSDCCLIYSGVATETISGLTFLSGKNVQVKSEGAFHPDRVVSATGEITLQEESTYAEVGLAYDKTIDLLEQEINTGQGSMQGQIKQRGKVLLRVVSSFPPILDGTTYDQNSNWRPARTTLDLMDTPVPLYTGDLEYCSSTYGKNLALSINQPRPFPMTLLAIFCGTSFDYLE